MNCATTTNMLQYGLQDNLLGTLSAMYGCTDRQYDVRLERDRRQADKPGSEPETAIIDPITARPFFGGKLSQNTEQ